MTLKYKITPFAEAKYAEEVTAELNKGRELNAFLQVFGYIEGYLREWMMISGASQNLHFHKNILEAIERVTFHNICLFHLIIGNIDNNLYKKLTTLSQFRNMLAHKIVTIDIDNNKTKWDIKRKTLEGIRVCEHIFLLYNGALDKKDKQISL